MFMTIKEEKAQEKETSGQMSAKNDQNKWLDSSIKAKFHHLKNLLVQVLPSILAFRSEAGLTLLTQREGEREYKTWEKTLNSCFISF